MLHFINNQIWKLLTGRSADGIEQSIDDEDEYRIIDQNPVTNVFISSDEQKKGVDASSAASPNPNCANFLAGIIEGVLNSSKMFCKCYAHSVPEEDPESANDADIQNVYSKSKKQIKM